MTTRVFFFMMILSTAVALISRVNYRASFKLSAERGGALQTVNGVVQIPSVKVKTVTSPPATESVAGTSVSEDILTSGITQIHLNLHQRALQLSLKDPSVHEEIKLQRIGFAVSQGLLPASFAQDAITAPSMVAGGLFDEWNFDLERRL